MKEKEVLTECQKKMRELREETGMNRKEFCEQFDIPYRTVTEWERAIEMHPVMCCVSWNTILQWRK